MPSPNIITRRSFLDRSFKAGLGVALGTLLDVPWVVKRALAEGNIGITGPDGKVKKILFIFLRGANDALNSVIPVLDPSYSTANRPNILIPKDVIDYSTTGPADFPASGVNPTFSYNSAIRLGNGFAGLHPSLKFLAPVYNAGDLALIHRVGYPKQSRSHFDSQNYWETGTPNNNVTSNGIFYRAMAESGLASTNSLTGVSIQSALPLSLRGNAAAMTNLTDPLRYALLGIPNYGTNGNVRAESAIRAANAFSFTDKRDRELINLQYQNLTKTLQIFSGIDFTENGNTFRDDINTDGDAPYYLFPTTTNKNGGYDRSLAGSSGANTNKYAVDTGAYGFFQNLKAAALILNKTDAIIAGTEMSGFDTHNNQIQGGSTVGIHANLLRRIGWAIYALRKYFQNNADQTSWNDTIIVTLSEFGRSTVQNASLGTDHAEAGLMFVAGGSVKGYGKPGTGVFGCHTNDAIPWVTGPTGSMFGASGRYLQRCIDYRSVLGRILRDHLGATPAQLNRIVPGYADESHEHLQLGGTSSFDGTPILGEIPFI